jgi:hypothetical protein
MNTIRAAALAIPLALSVPTLASGKPFSFEPDDPGRPVSLVEFGESLADGSADAPKVEAPADGPRRRTWEMPPVTVLGEKPAELQEEQRVGSYGQPRWTATRRVPGTRVYVVPEGKVELEYWLRPTFQRDGSTRIRSLYEVEIGLPHRFQLDLYFRTDQDSADDSFYVGGQFEVRYALADWGKIWGNPTLYLEYVWLEEREDVWEPKLLLGGEIAPRWHWGVNLVGEFELGGEREHEYQVTTAVSYTVIDSKFSVGAEALFIWADTKEDRGDFDNTIFVGPSFQWKPIPDLTINLAPLFGVTDDDPDARVFLNVGWEF